MNDNKNIIIFIFIVIGLAIAMKYSGSLQSIYLICTPASCPSGYNDNGVICDSTNGSCVRDCEKATGCGTFLPVASFSYAEDRGGGGCGDNGGQIGEYLIGNDQTYCYKMEMGACDIRAVVTGGSSSTYDLYYTKAFDSYNSHWVSDLSGGQNDDNLFNDHVLPAQVAVGDYSGHGSLTSVKDIYCTPTSVLCSTYGNSICSSNCYNNYIAFVAGVDIVPDGQSATTDYGSVDVCGGTGTFSDVSYGYNYHCVASVQQAPVIYTSSPQSCNKQLVCNESRDCGIDGNEGNNYCNATIGGSVVINKRIYTCNNPATSSAYCSNAAVPQLVQACTGTQTCSNAACHDVCDSSSDCGVITYGGNKCSGNTIVRTKTTPSCNNPGVGSSCIMVNATETVQTCSGDTPLCSYGVCVPNPVNGACGTTFHTCTTGNIGSLGDTNNNYNWQCAGTNGGLNSSCTAVRCVDTNWTDSSIICAGQTFTQISNCGNQRQSTGTELPICPSASTIACAQSIQPSNSCGTCSGYGTYCAAGVCGNGGCTIPCVDQTWSPEPSNICSGVNFMQTSNCGNQNLSIGTSTSGTCQTQINQNLINSTVTQTTTPSSSDNTGIIIVLAIIGTLALVGSKKR